MKVLILTYYWPPSGGSGVQRWLKFVKYLQDFDIEPIVYTVENPNYPILDESLSQEIPKNITILKQPIWEPNNFLSFFKKSNTKQSAGFLNPNPGFVGKSLQFIRANYFIPDARKFWIKPSVKFLEKYLKINPVDLIISTGPPHSLHLIGQQLKEKLGLKWIVDFRDPWTNIDYFHQLPLTKKSLEKHITLEQEVLKKADAVIAVGETMKAEFVNQNKNIKVITNGFDTVFENENSILDSKFSITHIGIMNADRNPEILWKVLSEICEENPVFKNDLLIKLVGRLDKSVLDNLSKFDKANIEKIDYVSHKEVTKYQQNSQLLVLAINNVPNAKGILTGKIFEYLQAKRPILGIGPEDGDAATILNNTNAGVMCGFKNETKLKSVILNFYKNFKNKQLNVDSKNIHQYHRKELTRSLADLIKNTVNN